MRPSSSLKPSSRQRRATVVVGAPGTVPFQPKDAPPYLPKLNYVQHMREAGHGDVRSYFGTIFWPPLGDPGGGTIGIVESEDGDSLLIPASPTGGG
jgi:hypothetical protein